MSPNHYKRVWVAIAAISGIGAMTTAFAQPPEFVKAELQRKAFVRAQASSKASRPAQPANEAEAVAQKKMVREGIIEIPLPEDRMLYTQRTVDAQGKAHVGHVESKSSAHAYSTHAEEKPNE